MLTDIYEVLQASLEKYAAHLVRDDAILRKYTSIENIRSRKTSYQRLNEALLKAGDVLEANIENGFIVAVIPTGTIGVARAVVVACIKEDTLSIAAFFKEGLIKQNGAQKAIAHIKKYL